MIHPLDHVLRRTFVGSSVMTDVTKVTLKIRKNGGAATTYTNVSAPAITAQPDNTFAFDIELAANTYADGDKLAGTWLYNAVPVTSFSVVVGPAVLDGAHYTNARGDLLANLDATVSSRSTYAGADTAGTTTLLARLTATRAGNLDFLDAAVSGVAAAVWSALTAGFVTAGSFGKLLKDTLDAAISSRSTYAGADTAGTTTLLGRLTAGRAGNLDNIDAAVSSRAATADARFGNLDAAVSSRSTYAGADTAGTTTLLARLTAQRAANLDFLDAAISSVVTAVGNVAANVWGAVARTLTANPGLTSAQVANAVWDEPLAGHATVGTAGKTLSLAGSGGVDYEAIADAVWDEDLGEHVAAATFGKKLQDMAATGKVTYIGPVAVSGDASLVKGCDYLAAAGTALAWQSDSWPDLTGATVHLVGKYSRQSFDVTGTATPGATQHVSFDVPKTVTDPLNPADYGFAVIAVLSGGHGTVPLVRGTLSLDEQAS